MRRRFSHYSEPAGSNVGSVEVGESHVKVVSPGSSVPVTAGIVGRTHDKEGRLTSLVLDSLVHERHKTNFGEFEAWGVFVTELLVKERQGEDEDEAEAEDDDE